MHTFVDGGTDYPYCTDVVCQHCASALQAVRAQVHTRHQAAAAATTLAENLAGGVAEFAALSVTAGSHRAAAAGPYTPDMGTHHALSPSPSSMLLSDGSEDRMFQRLQRTGVIRSSRSTSSQRVVPGRPQSASTPPTPNSLRAANAAITERAALLLAAVSSPNTTLPTTTPRGPRAAATAAYFSGLTRQGDRPATSDSRRPLGGLGPHATGTTTTTLSDEELDRLAGVAMHRWSAACSNKVAEPCCVCLEVMALGEGVRMLSCGHRLHGLCLKEWLRGKSQCVCPLCRCIAS